MPKCQAGPSAFILMQQMPKSDKAKGLLGKCFPYLSCLGDSLLQCSYCRIPDPPAQPQDQPFCVCCHNTAFLYFTLEPKVLHPVSGPGGQQQEVKRSSTSLTLPGLIISVLGILPLSVSGALEGGSGECGPPIHLLRLSLIPLFIPSSTKTADGQTGISMWEKAECRPRRNTRNLKRSSPES